jgi:flagellar biosynthesis protein FlhG
MNMHIAGGNCAATIHQFPSFGHDPNRSWQETAAGRDSRRGIRVISVTSGKGGVGKSNVVANLAMAMSRIGKKVLIIDADLGLGNINVLLGLRPTYTLNDLFSGEKSLSEIIVSGPCGIKLIPAGSGTQKYTRLSKEERLRLLNELDELEEDFDMFIIDTESGISDNVVYFTSAAQEIVVVVSPEPTSITDCYALIKLLATTHNEHHFKVLINMVHDSDEALKTYYRLASVVGRFLDISLDYLGYICRDELLIDSVKRQKAVFELYPDSASSRCFSTLARRICQTPSKIGLKGNIQFMFRRFLRNPLELRYV